MGSALSYAQRLEVTLPDDPAAVIAVVGNSNVLLGDLLPQVMPRIAEVEKSLARKFPSRTTAFS